MVNKQEFIITIKRYLRFYLAFIKTSVKRDMEYRLDLVTRFTTEILWAIIVLGVLELIFRQTKSIAGWSKFDAQLLVVVFYLAFDLLWAIVGDNLGRFSFLIRNGYLDRILLWPKGKMFTISFAWRSFNIFHLLRPALALALLLTLLIRGYIKTNFLQLIYFVITLLNGIMLAYFIFFIFSCFTFWFVRFENLQWIVDEILHVGSRPKDIWPQNIANIFTFVLPVFFLGSIPTAILLNKMGLDAVLFSSILVIFFALFARAFFIQALKKYESVGS